MTPETLIPYAELAIIITLIITNILTFRYQKNKISLLESTNKSFKDLIDGQNSHILGYKEMVKMDSIKEHIKIQISNAIEKEREEFIKTVPIDAQSERLINEMFSKDLVEAWQYIMLTLIEIGIHNDQVRANSFLLNFLPRNKSSLQKLLSNQDFVNEIQKFRNQ